MALGGGSFHLTGYPVYLFQIPAGCIPDGTVRTRLALGEKISTQTTPGSTRLFQLPVQNLFPNQYFNQPIDHYTGLRLPACRELVLPGTGAQGPGKPETTGG